MIAAGLYSLLSGDAGVAAIVSSRIYPQLPQNATYPCISYQIEEQTEDSTFDGQGTFGQVELMIDCWADDYDSILTLGAAVKTALKNYSGDFSGTKVQHIRLDANATVFDQTVGQDGKYRASQVYTLYR